MSAVIIQFPRTSAGRDALRYFLAGFSSSPRMRLFLATDSDWDEIAEDLRRFGTKVPRRHREAR